MPHSSFKAETVLAAITGDTTSVWPSGKRPAHLAGAEIRPAFSTDLEAETGERDIVPLNAGFGTC